MTEKKVIEEELALAERFSKDFQNELTAMIQIFTNYVQDDSLVNLDRLKNTVTMQEIKYRFALDKNGVYHWPHFVNNKFKINTKTSSNSYILNLKKAENNEFILRDFKNAKKNYLKTLIIAKNKSDSVYVFNALARLYVKLDQPKKAVYYYTKIINDFGNTTNNFRFPYAYFAASKLLTIQNVDLNTEIKKPLISFLIKLSDGSIPLNDSSAELLSQIAVWAQQLTAKKDVELIENLIARTNVFIDGFNNYNKPVFDILQTNDSTSTTERIDDFYVIKPLSEKYDELFLFKKNKIISFGFSVSLMVIFDLVVQNQVSDNMNFQYQIKLIPNDRIGYTTSSYLETSSNFSPYFTNHKVQINLLNEEIVEEYVFRKKLFYGLGLMLLLGTMILGLVVLIQDVQRKKHMAKLRDDFVSNVTHELKTPLTSINMFADSILLGRVKTDKDLKKYANIIVKESEKLKRMITNILDFSKTENDKLAYNLKECNLSEIVIATLEEMKYWLEINSFKTTVEVEKNVIVMADAEGIQQALYNLISNAIKFSISKKELHIRLFKKDFNTFLEIEDSGIGIPKENIGHIFDKFYRVNSKENETISGTGLGLTVTRDIIEAQNGQLKVNSTFGKGSKFTIIITT
ncbi:MAG: hypothetical protein COA92_02195 [Sulfurovum sp.]|nr:MAG: hypothetical protein COA92_02195 [Sulfurovum sp.]